MTTVEDADVLTTAPTRASRWTTLRARWALVLMLVCAALTGLIGYAGQLGYAALIGVVGIASLPMLGVKRPPILEVGIALLLVLWCAASELWTIDKPPLHLYRYKDVESLTALKLLLEVGIYSAFLFLMRELPERWANRVIATLVIGLTACAVAMTIDAFTDCSLYRFFRLSAHAPDKPEIIRRNAARGAYTLALLFWPAVLWMRRSNWTAALIVFVLAFFASAIGFRVDAPIVAVVLGGAALFAVRRFGRMTIWLLLAGTVIYLALEPTFFDVFGRYLPSLHDGDGVAKESWGARIKLWRMLAQMIAERPFIGWGIDSSRVIEGVPLHPHSASIQLWLELGAVGAALGVLFWAALWGRIGGLVEKASGQAEVAAAVAVAYLTIGALSFGIWQEWWIALGVLAAVVCMVFGEAFQNWSSPSDRLEELLPTG